MRDQGKSNQHSSDFLVIPKGFIGDFILMSPVFRALKESYPNRRVVLLAPPALAGYAERNECIDEVIVFDRRKEFRGLRGLIRFAKSIQDRNFGVACSFHGSWRTAVLLKLAKIPTRIGYAGNLSSLLYSERVFKDKMRHEVLRNMSLVRRLLPSSWQTVLDLPIELAGKSLPLHVPAISDEGIPQRLKQLFSSQETTVVLAPGSAWETKQWSPHKFREVADSIIRRGMRVVVVGAKNDERLARVVCENHPDLIVNVCGETTLAELTYLIAKADGLICNDSLALHIASAVQTPSVAVFCATSPKFGFGPWNNRAIVVEKGQLFCKPCRRHGSRRCPIGTMSCSSGIPVSSVLQSLDDVMSFEKDSIVELREV